MKGYAANETDSLKTYLSRVFTPEDEILREVRERSDREGLPGIQVGPMDALHLEVLVRMSGARKAVEIGTLGGYSGISILRGMPADGRLYTFEYSPKHAEVALESFRKAGFGERVQIFVGEAARNLSQIESKGPFDLVFCDADKPSYPQYLEWAAANLRIGGVLIGDNTLGWGMIADERFDDAEDQASVTALQKFNHAAARGGRFRATLLPTGEGLTVAVKIK
jgi:caffeoyl-CoA O-methyltransferase